MSTEPSPRLQTNSPAISRAMKMVNSLELTKSALLYRRQLFRLVDSFSRRRGQFKNQTSCLPHPPAKLPSFAFYISIVEDPFDCLYLSKCIYLPSSVLSQHISSLISRYFFIFSFMLCSSRHKWKWSINHWLEGEGTKRLLSGSLPYWIYENGHRKERNK